MIPVREPHPPVLSFFNKTDAGVLCVGQSIQWTLFATVIINFVVAIPVAIYSQLHCDPYDALWDISRQAQCNVRANAAASYVAGGVAAASDLILAIVPMLILWDLQIQMRLKVGLCLLLGLGIVAAAAAILRTWACKFLSSADVSCESSPSRRAC